MGRLFALILILLLLSFVPSCSVKQTQPVFFSLLFPQLMPETGMAQWLSEWLGDTAGEAVAL